MRPILAAAGVVLGLALSPGATGQTTTTPKLRVAGQMVIGVGFRVRERVQVRFIAGATHTRALKTNGRGMFSTPLAPFDSCTQALAIKAVGARGDAASALVPKSNCLPK
jgi:hypothetical protein